MSHLLRLNVTVALILSFALVGYGHGIGGDQRNMAVDPDGVIYVITHDGMMGMGPNQGHLDESRLLAIGPNGRVRWSFDIEGFEAISPPVLGADGTVYFTATEMGFNDYGMPFDDDAESPEGRLFAVRNGQLKWAFDFEGMMASAPVLAPDGTIYFTTSFFHDFEDMGPGPNDMMNGGFFAIRDAQTQAVLAWNLEFDGPMISEPVIRTNATGFPWVTYVNMTDMGHNHQGQHGGMMDQVVLYEIHPDGSFRRIL